MASLSQNLTPAVISRLSYPGFLLGVAVLIATTLLTLGHLATRDAIDQRRAEDLIASLDQVLPAATRDNDLLAAPLDLPMATATMRIYRAERQKRIVAVAFSTTTTDGYGGPIELLIGVAADGSLLGVRTLSHSETPGLGDKIERAKSDWITHFNGHSLDNLPAPGWAVKKDGGRFDQFTGATVTPRAVIKAVHKALLFFREQQTRLLRARTEPLGGDSQ